VFRLVTNEINREKEIYGMYGLDVRVDCEISGCLISGKRKSCQVGGAQSCLRVAARYQEYQKCRLVARAKSINFLQTICEICSCKIPIKNHY
jgi:hypothetical protein